MPQRKFNNLPKGHLAKQWQHLQQKHLSDNATKKNNGVTWATNFIDMAYQQFFKAWFLRNGDRHGHDAKTKADADKRQAIIEMSQLYDKYDSTPTDLRWILATPLDTRIAAWSTKTMRAWINAFKPILEKGYTDALATG